MQPPPYSETGRRALGSLALPTGWLHHGVISFAACLLALSAPAVGAGLLEPDAALTDFELPAGFSIELVACEPEVVDPIAIAFDEDGRLWVVEMRDYPTLAPGEAPSSRIRVLEDRD